MRHCKLIGEKCQVISRMGCENSAEILYTKYIVFGFL